MSKQRWAFTESELANPAECKGDDELVAYVYTDTEFKETESYGIVVYRNGKVSNRFDDGTAGVPRGLVDLANDCESLLHPDGEETSVWKDVEADDQGNFVRFLD